MNKIIDSIWFNLRTELPIAEPEELRRLFSSEISDVQCKLTSYALKLLREDSTLRKTCQTFFLARKIVAGISGQEPGLDEYIFTAHVDGESLTLSWWAIASYIKKEIEKRYALSREELDALSDETLLWLYSMLTRLLTVTEINSDA